MTKLKNFLVTVVLGVSLLLGAVRVHSLETNPASTVIDKFHAALLSAMKKPSYSVRYTFIQPSVKDSFDFQRLAKSVLGSQWESLKPDQQTKFIDVFTKLSIATYASRFDGYNGEKFETLSEEPFKKSRLLVKTQLIKSNGEKVQLQYIMEQVGTAWKIINVIADGVSDLALKRADYTTTLKEKGYDALITVLNEKITKYEKEG
jgi:phospholipid transport system substrate-binding protein